ncbi:MAG: hypothetical protein ABJA62_02260 [Luteimonas sp.]
MNSSNKVFSLSALALGVSLLAAASGAQAATITRTLVANATAACQPALPVFDGNIRARPKAVQNDGTNNAFVSCAYYSQSTVNTAGNPKTVEVSFSTKGGVAMFFSCTGIVGAEGTTFPVSVKSNLLPADGSRVSIIWSAVDFGGIQGNPLPSGLFGLSCNLPPTVGINDATITFDEDVGA